MKSLQTLRSFLAIAVFCLSAPLLAAIDLAPVVSGLTSPIFVGHAGDGSNRLFIVEQPGVIKVLQPGSSIPSVFLDIQGPVLSGGERGLLGLAFHPTYETNGRFFVYYTSDPVGDIVIAEYHVSPGNPNQASTTETILLTIPHSANTNHNGGMLAFGPDGFLYAGVGDGGSGNDPPNNAQNINVLLGKILRLDVDTPNGSIPYSSPSDNPYFGATAGRDEIHSIGWRNPWRFSFDRLTGQQWVADVGQGAREEVDTPIVLGGNYGWRVYEGSVCTTNDPPLCSNTYIPPIFDYTHSGGRCSITGGYVYRGPAGALPAGTYVFGDYCTGEIFQWDGSAQILLLDTTMNISSFGEDEAGEMYVVNLGGSVSRIVSTTPCTYAINPTSQSAPASGGTGSVGVTAGAGCGWTAVENATWLHVTSGIPGSGNGSVGYSVDANTGNARSGSLTIAGKTFTVNQAAAPVTCTYAISPSSRNVGAGTSTGTVSVTAGTGCGWTAAPNATWLHVTAGATGSGNGSAGYSVDANTGGARSGTLTIAGKTFTVNQAALACTYAISPASATFTRAGGDGSVAVTTRADCPWTATNGVTWIQITNVSATAGNGTVSYHVDPQPPQARKRSGTLKIAGKSFKVTQNK